MVFNIDSAIKKLNKEAERHYNLSKLFDDSEDEKRIKKHQAEKAEEKWQIARWLMELSDIKEKLKPLESHIEQKNVCENEVDWLDIAEKLYSEIKENFAYNLKEFHWEMSEDVFDSLTWKFGSNKNENVTLFGLEIWEVSGTNKICLKL